MNMAARIPKHTLNLRARTGVKPYVDVRLPSSTAGLQGKLQKLQGATLDMSQENYHSSLGDGLAALDKLLEGCVARKKDKMNKAAP